MNRVRLAVALGAALLTMSTAANANPVTYGLVFDRTYSYVNPYYGVLCPASQDPSGSFTFDAATNQLVSFDVYPGFAPTIDFSPQVFALFAAADPCNLQCFIASINGSSWSTSVGNYDSLVKTTLDFGGPLNGQAIASAGPPMLPYGLEGIGGVYRVSNAPVPEPSTWAMMVLAFGFVGGALRSGKRTQKLTVSYA